MIRTTFRIITKINQGSSSLFVHVAEMGDEEIVEQIYGNYPPQETEGDYTLKRGESIVL